MWIALSGIAIAIAICLGVAAVMMRHRDATRTELTPLSSQDASLRSVDADLKTLLASPEVRSVMRADHVDKRQLLVELNLISKLRKDAGPIPAFDQAVRRLRNMSEMMDRLGFDSETVARTDLNVTSVFYACQICPADEVCHDWLVRASKSPKCAPAFCPNVERFGRARQLTT